MGTAVEWMFYGLTYYDKDSMGGVQGGFFLPFFFLSTIY